MNNKRVIQNKVLILKAFYLLLGMSLFLIPLIHAWMFYPLGIENINTRFSSAAQIQKKSFISTSTQATHWETTTAHVLSYKLLTAGLVGSLFIKAVNTVDITPHFSCAQNETAIVTRNISGAPYIDLLKNSEQFKKTLARSALEVQQPFLKVLEPNFSSNTTAVSLVYDVQSADTQFIIAPLNVFQSKTKWMGLCTTKIPGIENTIR